VSIADNFDNMRKKFAPGAAVRIGNPKTEEFQIVRTSLLPGLFKTIASNKSIPLPIKVFEISDVVLRIDSGVGAGNERRLAAVYCNTGGGFEVCYQSCLTTAGHSIKVNIGLFSGVLQMIHGLLDRTMMMLNVPIKPKGSKEGYFIAEAHGQQDFWEFYLPFFFCFANSTDLFFLPAAIDETFFSGRCASINYHGEQIGIFGLVHPEVLQHFQIPFPLAALEFNVEKFL
jgi:phenylalanyl-tRNA synthetase beta chain